MKLVYTPILLLLSVICFAQKPLSVKYYKNGFRYVKSIDSADFIRAILPPDSGSHFYQVRDYYARSKKIRFKGAILDAQHVNYYEGKCELFYPDGHLKLRAFYMHGRIWGKAYEYNPDGKLQSVKQYPETRNTEPLGEPLIITCIDSAGNAIVNNGNGYYRGYRTSADFDTDRMYEEGHIVNGLRDGTWHGSTNPIRLSYTTPASETPKVKFAEQYESSMLVSGMATDSTSTQYHYTQRMQDFSFVGGMKSFETYLQESIKYPIEARRKNITGRVIIAFDINADNTISNLKVVRSVNPELDNEALRVLKQSSGKWVCAKMFGVSLKTSVSIPISFTLN